jgi:uncharacterized protein
MQWHNLAHNWKSKGLNMLYAIMATDVPDSLSRRLESRPAHVARLQQLQAAGRLVMAGPHPSIDTEDPGEAGFSGSLIVAEFESLEAARTWADADPYITAGVYGQVVVKPFKRVLPA